MFRCSHRDAVIPICCLHYITFPNPSTAKNRRDSARHTDIHFEYDENAYEITMDDHTDDEDLVILTGKDAA